MSEYNMITYIHGYVVSRLLEYLAKLFIWIIHIISNENIILNNEVGTMLKKEVVAYFKVSLQNFGRTEENREFQ